MPCRLGTRVKKPQNAHHRLFLPKAVVQGAKAVAPTTGAKASGEANVDVKVEQEATEYCPAPQSILCGTQAHRDYRYGEIGGGGTDGRQTSMLAGPRDASGKR